MFKPNQKLVCIDDSLMRGEPQPHKNDIVTFAGYPDWYHGCEFILLKEYDPDSRAFRSTCFRPLISIDDLNIEQYLQPVETLETV